MRNETIRKSHQEWHTQKWDSREWNRIYLRIISFHKIIKKSAGMLCGAHPDVWTRGLNNSETVTEETRGNWHDVPENDTTNHISGKCSNERVVPGTRSVTRLIINRSSECQANFFCHVIRGDSTMENVVTIDVIEGNHSSGKTARKEWC